VFLAKDTFRAGDFGYGLLFSSLGAGLVIGSFAVGVLVGQIRMAVLYGGAIALVGTYEGYVTGAGAEGVGKSTAKTVVISAVTILVLDSLVAAHLSRFIQG
jgi:phospholipid/cholesterol/gamma-HCH transport system permease protein